MNRLLPALLLLPVLFWAAPLRAQSPTAALATLQAAYSNQVAAAQREVGAEREKMQAQVLKELKTMEDRLAARGDLQALVQCQKAQKLAAEGWLEWSLDHPGPDLTSLQKSILLAQARLEESLRRRLETLRKQYAGQLEQSKLALTRQKRVEEALVVQKEIDALRTDSSSTPAPPPAAPTPLLVAQPQAPGSRLVLFSFEAEKELKSWEFREGPPVTRVERKATEGRHALLLHGSNLLVTMDLHADWRGYKTLEFDVFLEGPASLPVEVTIGDQAWLDRQNYWNRHNRFETIKAGFSTLSIPTQDLFRGEKGVKNKELSQELHLDAIRYLSLKLGPPTEATIYLDHIRLVK